MSFRNRLFLAAAACALVFSGAPSNLAAQQTTKDGIRLENAVNRPDRPYRQARRIALAISGKLNDQLGDRGRRRIVTIRDVQIGKGRLEPGGESSAGLLSGRAAGGEAGG